MDAIIIISAIVFFATSIGVTPVLAQEYNCKDPQYQQEMNYCAALDFTQADRKLNTVYPGAIAVMKEMDRDLPPELAGAEKALRQAQRDWVKYRYGACKAEGFLFRGGTMEPLIVSTCMTRLTERRISDLQILEQMAY